MALIKCPDCGNDISDKAENCPKCGLPQKYISIQYSTQNNKSVYSNKNNGALIISVIASVLVISFIVIVMGNDNSSTKGRNKRNSYANNYNYTSSYSYSSTSSSSSSPNDASTIFKNLDIKDFSCSSGKYSGSMQCKVTNNNSYTVRGYFRVNFYDSSGKLLYNQLMALPDVAPGESVVCSTSIPKDDYPYDYKSVDFSQASLITKD